MRTTRLAAAGVAAVVGLSSAIAAADTTGEQTVTIAVAAAPRSITVGEPTGDPLTVAVGATASGSQTSTLAYSAGSDDAAKIVLQHKVFDQSIKNTETNAGWSTWPDLLGDLTLQIQADAAGGSEGTASTVTLDRAPLDTVEKAVPDFVTGIAVNEIVTGKQITYTLGGTATNIGFPGRIADVVITFTIVDEGADKSEVNCAINVCD